MVTMIMVMVTMIMEMIMDTRLMNMHGHEHKQRSIIYPWYHLSANVKETLTSANSTHVGFFE